MKNSNATDPLIFETKGNDLWEIKGNHKHLSIPDGIKAIFCSFATAQGLESLIIPESVEFIQTYAFSGCHNLKTVISHSPVLFNWWVNNHKYNGKTLSEMETIDLEKYTNSDGKPFTKISDTSFDNCNLLRNFIVGPFITELDANFDNCKNLEHIEINKNVQSMNVRIFSQCSKLKPENVISHSPALFFWWVNNHKYNGKTLSEMETIDLEKYPNSDGKPFTIIENGAFFHCDENLKKFNTGSFVTTIGSDVFEFCHNLKYAEIGKNIQSIGMEIFLNCPKLKSENVISHSPVLFDWWVQNHKYGNKTLSEMKTIDLEKFTNSDGKPFTVIQGGSFICSFKIQPLKRLNIGSFVTRIERNAFRTCYNLEYVEIGKNVQSISRGNFSYSSDLKSENFISHSPTLFDWWVDNHKYDGKTLSEMEEIDLNRYTNNDKRLFTSVSENALDCCFKTKNILFGNSIRRIDKQNLKFCDNLKNIQISNKEILLDPKAFSGISKLVNFYVCNEQIKEKLQEIGIDTKRIFIKPIPKEELEETKENKIELTC